MLCKNNHNCLHLRLPASFCFFKILDILLAVINPMPQMMKVFLLSALVVFQAAGILAGNILNNDDISTGNVISAGSAAICTQVSGGEQITNPGFQIDLEPPSGYVPRQSDSGVWCPVQHNLLRNVQDIDKFSSLPPEDLPPLSAWLPSADWSGMLPGPVLAFKLITE